jgi:predicted metal-dependent phosphoesterase TrpH
LAAVITAAERAGLDGLAVLDHNSIEGAVALAKMAPFQVIVGEEIYTPDGEIAGLFLQERIPPGQSLPQTVDCIREQGGLVYVPHPFDKYRGSAIGEQALVSVCERVDVLEVLNARVLVAADNCRAAEFAAAHGLAAGAGSDAHTAQEIGAAFVEMPAFDGAESFRHGLERAEICGELSSPHVHLQSTWAKIRRRLCTPRD